MDWNERIFRYCERGGDPVFWAEPLNAATNGAFIIAALFALLAWWRGRADTRGAPEGFLIVLMFAMGIGSFLFHTFATRWATYADTVPIGVFMLTYFGYALRRFFGLGWIGVFLGLAGFVASLKFAGGVHCGAGFAGVTGAANGTCLNGTAAYVPAFLAMAAIGAGLAMTRHPAWRGFAAAAAIFLVSMALRTIDWQICDLTRLGGHRLGTHFLWHILNAATLYILVQAALRHGRVREARA